MLNRVVVGVVLLAAVLALGALVQQLRASGRPVLRTVGGRVHRGVGVIALAFLVLLAVTAVRLLVG